MGEKIRMADIAKALGISVVSVSKGLSGQYGVSEETRLRIFRKAEELGYDVNKFKKGASSGNIGILVADRFMADNAFYTNLYLQVLSHSKATGYSALLEIITPQAEKNAVPPQMLKKDKVDGVILMGNLEKCYIQMIAKAKTPYILLDFYSYDDVPDTESIVGDNMNGAMLLTDGLIRSGIRDIGFVGSVHSTTSIMDRYLGYVKSLLKAKMMPDPMWLLEDRDEEGEFIELQLPEKMPQAFVCSCDEVAFNLVNKLTQAGYSVPEDVSVTGYDDYHFSQLCDPPLTTYRVNTEEMAKMAVARLIRRINGKQTSSGQITIYGSLIKKKSTR